MQRLTWQHGLIAFAVASGFLLIAMFAGRLIRRHLSKRARGGSVFALSKLITYAVSFVGVATGLNLLGVPLRSLMLTSSALLVGIGFQSTKRCPREFTRCERALRDIGRNC